MASTTFIDNQTTIYAAWLNDVNTAVYNGTFPNGSLSLTTLAVSGTVSGAGFTSLINNTFTAPGPIGSVTPSTGGFTTLSATSVSANSLSLTTALPASSGGTGLSSVGTSGFVLASNGSALVYKKLGLGMTGEIWNTVTRSLNVTYTNSNSYPIQLGISVFLPSGAGFTILVNGVAVGQDTNAASTRASFYPIVPTGATYVVTGTGTITHWAELY